MEVSVKLCTLGEDMRSFSCKMMGSERICTTQGQDGGVMLNDSMKTLAPMVCTFGPNSRPNVNF